MPWITIIMWLISYFLKKDSGASTTDAALTATGVAAASYYTIEPTNSESLWGSQVGEFLGLTPSETENGLDTPVHATSTSGSTAAEVEGMGTTLIKSTADTLQSWGPLGTVGVIGGVSAATSSNTSKMWMWGALALGAFLLLK